jgi:hypothetical protein
MIIYWGDKFSAKTYIRHTASINEKDLTIIPSGIKSRYVIQKSSSKMISENIWELTEDIFYKTQNEIKCFTTNKTLCYQSLLEWGYNITKNRNVKTKKKESDLILKSDRINDWFNKTTNMNINIEPINSYEMFDIFHTSDLLITSKKLISDVRSDFEKKQLLDLLQKSTNLISYNSDIMHYIMCHILVDLLNLDQDELYSALDKRIQFIKDIKSFLEDNNIKYDWYDINTLNPLWDRPLPKDWNKQKFEDSFTDTVKSKSEEYIRSRGITDLRTV